MTEFQRTYGGALYELAREEKLEKELLSELSEVVGIIEKNPDYVKLMGLASVPKEERLKSLDECFGGRVHRYLLNFLKLLAERGGFGEVSGCLAAFNERYNADNGILTAEAVSARELTEKERELLTAKLGKITGKKILLTTRVDASLLGGVRISMDGRLYDGSVRKRLGEIEKSLRDAVL